MRLLLLSLLVIASLGFTIEDRHEHSSDEAMTTSAPLHEATKGPEEAVTVKRAERETNTAAAAAAKAAGSAAEDAAAANDNEDAAAAAAAAAKVAGNDAAAAKAAEDAVAAKAAEEAASAKAAEEAVAAAAKVAEEAAAAKAAEDAVAAAAAAKAAEDAVAGLDHWIAQVQSDITAAAKVAEEAGAAKAAEEEETRLAEEEAAAAAAAEPGVQLARVTASGRLEVTSEGRGWLHRLGATPMRVVAITGMYHSGKSSLLNRLVGRRSFSVQSSTDPTTKGIWATSSNDTIWVDTEGLAAVGTPEATDAKTFATAALFSSLLLYNSRQLVDARQLEYLDLLTRRASLFSLRTALSNEGTAERWVEIPALQWVVQNAVYDFETEDASQWLNRLATEQAHLHGAPLLDLFPSVHCSPIGIPSVDPAALLRLDLVPERDLAAAYRQGLADLKELVIQKASVKTVAGLPANGAALSNLLATLVEAANEGLVPALPSLWESFQIRTREAAKEGCTEAYDRVVESEAEAAVREQQAIKRQRAN